MRQFVIFLVFLVFQGLIGQRTLKGVVFVDENANGVLDGEETRLSRVLVSNGKDIVATDNQGNYSINTINDNPIFIVKPSGYISRLDADNKTKFYREEGDNSKSFNFPLYKNKEPKDFTIALLGDLQVDVMDDVHHVGKLVTEELARNKPDFIVPLGDLSFDNHDIFNPLSKILGLIGAPIFYVIGNHDLNFGEASLEKRDRSYEEIFGPSYYAFEYGQQLFVVLNNNFPLKERTYEGRIDINQLEFIKNLVDVKSKEYSSIKLFMHIPLEETVNKEALLSILAPFSEVFFATGHTHTQYHNYHPREGRSEVHELIAGAVCGAWWQGSHDIRGVPFALMYDGTPKGYWLMDVGAESYTLNYKVSGSGKDHQMNIWLPEKNEWDTDLNFLNEPFIYANVFAADTRTEVSISFGNDQWVPMEKHEGIAPELIRFNALQELGRYEGQKISHTPKATQNSKHLWRVKIPDDLASGTYLIQVKAENEKLNLNAFANRVLWID
ncbi:3',5'-cyclic AMP phosphodiesterase CpdA [Arenibacter nanhaiticus]|uniref:3',5'-cyclic AMP phosphodiesterase CpdA n=1 Tax=Arenibacter nanhaiticus TaxID=558155 RepID=A0A1M6FT35_9FLAO|nr:calcineurin-like phosphoesterase family protein [Arenibacter nanhaiticus]SHJ00855.1 3',5'-cyclic AMP phosphodiesterase CpdA [Arenibacter nanhaiticus]